MVTRISVVERKKYAEPSLFKKRLIFKDSLRTYFFASKNTYYNIGITKEKSIKNE